MSWSSASASAAGCCSRGQAHGWGASWRPRVNLAGRTNRPTSPRLKRAGRTTCRARRAQRPRPAAPPEPEAAPLQNLPSPGLRRTGRLPLDKLGALSLLNGQAGSYSRHQPLTASQPPAFSLPACCASRSSRSSRSPRCACCAMSSSSADPRSAWAEPSSARWHFCCPSAWSRACS